MSALRHLVDDTGTMPECPADVREAAVSLLRLADAHPPLALLDVLRDHVTHLGWIRDVHLLLIDYAEQTLVRARRAGSKLVDDPYPVDRSEAGKAFALSKWS
jgi:hypothetical protein